MKYKFCQGLFWDPKHTEESSVKIFGDFLVLFVIWKSNFFFRFVISSSRAAYSYFLGENKFHYVNCEFSSVLIRLFTRCCDILLFIFGSLNPFSSLFFIMVCVNKYFSCFQRFQYQDGVLLLSKVSSTSDQCARKVADGWKLFIRDKKSSRDEMENRKLCKSGFTVQLDM